jgi:hypothetical protein
MEYDDFIAGYRAGFVRLGVDRVRISRVVGHPLYEQLIDSHDYPRFLNRLATVFTGLIIPSLIAAIALSFLTAWWALVPCLGLTWLLWAMSYRCQREGVRQLVVEDSKAYSLLLQEGVIVVDK